MAESSELLAISCSLLWQLGELLTLQCFLQRRIHQHLGEVVSRLFHIGDASSNAPVVIAARGGLEPAKGRLDQSRLFGADQVAAEGERLLGRFHARIDYGPRLSQLACLEIGGR